MSPGADERYTSAMLTALRSGINFIDTSLNYRHQRSERAIGQAILQVATSREIDRDEYVVCTKAGYLVPGAVPEGLRSEDVAGGMHSMAPAFLRDQLERSRVNLGIETVDVFYLHNPETQLQTVDADTFYGRVAAAFEMLEQLGAEGRIQYYGTATWQGFRVQNGLSLHRLAGIAREIAGDAHRFRFIQLPFNLAMTEAFTLRNQDGASTLAAARDLGITVIASASLLQARLVRELPQALATHLGDGSNAQRALQFTRSTPGVTAALAGMSSVEHVKENMGIVRTAPMTAEQYMRVYEAMR
jgi:aryl-alcohol dehydrogenase-like predicted oxidoreductase